ncbi:MAG: class I SAM-dependent RNA methyltransferase [Pseudomonadota bacterium]|nr:class I SAM-dependent RNA methyltransferase [Pseudomonadota bacterium]
MKTDSISEEAGRTGPECIHFGACGGCSLQDVPLDRYREEKRAQVVEALERRGLSQVPVLPLVPTPVRSRRRAMLAARKAGGRVLLGFNERRSSRIVDITGCTILVPALMALLPRLRVFLQVLLKEGPALDVSLTALPDGVDILLTGRLDLSLEAREAVAAFAAQGGVSRVAVASAPYAEAEPLIQLRPCMTFFGGVPVAMPPGAFLQASAEGEQALVRLVVDAVGAAVTVADLFSGCGTFTFPLAKTARVHAFETSALAVQAIQATGQRGVTATRRDLDQDPLTVKELSRFQAVVLDPPRRGAQEQCRQLARSDVPVLVFVSCSPDSFARDARILADGGYRPVSVTPVDQFVWSSHIELVGVFVR